MATAPTPTPLAVPPAKGRVAVRDIVRMLVREARTRIDATKQPKGPHSPPITAQHRRCVRAIVKARRETQRQVTVLKQAHLREERGQLLPAYDWTSGNYEQHQHRQRTRKATLKDLEARALIDLIPMDRVEADAYLVRLQARLKAL